MLINPPQTELLKKIPNQYVLVMATAKRARQITEHGGTAAIPLRNKAISIAAEELYRGDAMIFGADNV